ncbi:MAG: DUF3747 domain-containing protein [Cyanobacteriota bacterium]|nr:DUF3747 domain-containing protein [Cyanobacteriota bacterium]
MGNRFGARPALRDHRSSLLLFGAGIGLAGWSLASHQQAVAESLFGAEPVQADSTLAIAQPLGDDRWALALVERTQPGRHCWRERSDGTVHLRPEDFLRPGLCSRVQSSNSYSLRTAGQDLPSYWRLRIEPTEDRLELQAFNPSQPTPIVIGVSDKPSGTGTDETPAFRLNTGWTVEKRSYEGRLLNHLYLSNRQPLGTLLSAAAAGSGTLPVAPPPLLPARAEPGPAMPEPGQVIALQVVPFRSP